MPKVQTIIDDALREINVIAAIKLALAANLAPQYGTSLSGESAALLDYYVNIVRRANIEGTIDNVDMSHLPEGMGHWGNRYDISTDS